MKKIGLLSILLACVGAQQLQATPEKVRCIVREQPATSMVIGWSQPSGENPMVYYGTTDGGQDPSKYSNAIAPQRIIYAKSMNNHFARLTNLKPNTVYYLIIKDSEAVTRRYWFKTLPDDHNHRLSIVGGGDSRNHRTGRKNANKMVAKLRPDLVLFDGDMTGGDTDWEWKEWFDDWQLTVSEDGRLAPVIVARGNHEFSNQSLYDLFDVKNPEIFYGITVARGLMRIYTLNSMIPSNGTQRDWLETDLAENTSVAWRMAQYHHPMRPHTTRKGEHESLRRYWAPLFEKYGVQLALECDSHVAKVTQSIRSTGSEPIGDEGFIRDDEKGVVYIGEGGWGAPVREADDAKNWTLGIGSFNHVNWLFVDLDKIEIRTIKTDNADAVGALAESNRFSLPPNIDIWKFNEDGVVSIINKHLAAFVPTEKISLMEIASASAEPLEEFVKLNWKTNNEEEHTKYRIEMSNDRMHWTKIGDINGRSTATSKDHAYEFTDKTINRGGKIYYRVIAVDVLGKEVTKQYFELRMLGSEEMEMLVANFNSGQLVIPLLMPYQERVTIELFDTKRKLVFRRTTDVPKGENKIPINIKMLNEGYYLLELSYRNRLYKKNIRVVKPSLPTN